MALIQLGKYRSLFLFYRRWTWETNYMPLCFLQIQGSEKYHLRCTMPLFSFYRGRSKRSEKNSVQSHAGLWFTPKFVRRQSPSSSLPQQAALLASEASTLVRNTIRSQFGLGGALAEKNDKEASGDVGSWWLPAPSKVLPTPLKSRCFSHSCPSKKQLKWVEATTAITTSPNLSAD